MKLEIVFLAIFAVLAVESWYVLKMARAAIKDFTQRSLDIFKVQIQTFEAEASAMQAIVQLHQESLRNLTASHISTTEAIAGTHAKAAAQLKSATDAHQLAATTIADATVELRRASEQINSMLNNSQIQTVAQHLSALRNFWVKQ